MEDFLTIFGKPEVTVKELLEKYNSLPNTPLKKRLGRIISAMKKKYVETGNYVGILNMSRYLGDYEKDMLLCGLLKQHPTSSLFVLAFANSEMHSYDQAYKMEILDHDNDEEALGTDTKSIFDTILCRFLSLHETREDLEYVLELVDGATWLNAYKEATSKLSQLWNLQELKFSFSSFFYKKTPNCSELIYIQILIFEEFKISRVISGFFYNIISILCNH